MAHIRLPDGLPGIIGLMAAYPANRNPLNDLANAVMVGPSSLTRGERELIAAFVSSRNQCRFCTNSHVAAAQILLGATDGLIPDMIADPHSAPLSDKMRRLLDIADKVRTDGRLVTDVDVAHARTAGADDQAIHDTVLITAMFCMVNRYIEGLATWTPRDTETYEEIGERIALHGYGSRPFTDDYAECAVPPPMAPGWWSARDEEPGEEKMVASTIGGGR